MAKIFKTSGLVLISITGEKTEVPLGSRISFSVTFDSTDGVILATACFLDLPYKGEYGDSKNTTLTFHWEPGLITDLIACGILTEDLQNNT